MHLYMKHFLLLIWIIGTAASQIDNDFRYISYEDLLPTSDRFTDGNVTSFSRLLFDVAREQIIIGARDHLYRTSLKLHLKERAVWEASPSIRETCLNKGQRDEDCHNYIMVLQSYGGNKLYTCGTYAYSPYCSKRRMENLNVTKYDKGVAKCPFNPKANITTHMSETGQMFIASPTDFSGSDPAILRADIAGDDNRMLRTKQYDSKWLNDPQFVGSFEHQDFVYFVFRERALEHINCGKIVYSRIARVCKNDPGGTVFFKENWTSFIKARLNCSLPGEYPFYFDEVQSIHYSAQDQLVYATFNTPVNSIQGAAICAFNISAIQKAFAGSFKYQESLKETWKRVDMENRAYHECQTGQNEFGVARRSTNLMESTKYQLMDQAVQPITLEPLHHAKLERFSHIAVDNVSTKLHENVQIIYVSTEEGYIKKISILPRTKETCVIEKWQATESPQVKIRTLQYLKETNSLYVGTDTSVMRIPSQHCSRHASKTSCINSMDPYCGWNEVQETCTTAPGGNALAKYWSQNANECPLLKSPIDGGWGAWSNYKKCAKMDSTEVVFDENGSNSDTCMCRTRKCDNPAPSNGGKECQGMNIIVTNCTVHGGWSDFSNWSACSQTCGIAVKTRRRTCMNPKPAHGGRVCVGPDREEIYCTNLPPCPIAKEQAVDGGWSSFGPWSNCSAICGGGFRIRKRKCDNPAPRNGGMECAGCHIDYEVCNLQPCTDIKKVSQWTPWLISTNGTESVEKRYKFACKAPVQDSSQIKVAIAKEEVRECQNCRKNEPCKAEGKSQWSCWSEWSACSVSCGVGIQQRYRSCLIEDNDLEGCDGVSKETRDCEMPTCESFMGWSEWSNYSNCNEDGEKVRFRTCLRKNPGPKECLGEEKQTKICKSVPFNEAHTATNDIHLGAFGWIAIVFICALCSVGSAIATSIIKDRRRQKLTAITGSPHYGSYPNQYSSLPTKDMDFRTYSESKPRRQSSFKSDSKFNGNGTLPKSINVHCNTPKILAKSYNDTDTATIKRNSHLNNAKMRLKDDEDKY
ncbi:semaphorin-5A [Culicoides brevitarsis]|uniref:semaphorin-5A n=1 Tax=Culicoides brevitarsis TaxID=469753 RepID=UPI00307C2E5F